VRGFIVPVLLWVLFLITLYDSFRARLQGDEDYDRAALREWIDESRFRASLPEIVREYLQKPEWEKRQEVEVQLQALADPTRMYGNQLPLFPTIYRIEVLFPPAAGDEPLQPIVWESHVPRARSAGQVRTLEHALLGPGEAPVLCRFEYQLHAYNTRQRDEQARASRVRSMGLLAIAVTVLASVWIYLAQRREGDIERRRAAAQQQIIDAERKHEESERKLLEQRIATQSAEQHALELKSQLYASIGIMAGSYAHNIKNLLVRPNDLLRRCMETDQGSDEQSHMLQEVRQTLGLVTERLQQILQTVRRDPTRAEMTRLDLNELVREIGRNWRDLAHEKWKLVLSVEPSREPLWIEGDESHLQQAIENLLFNARDATFEMRNHLREQARKLGTKPTGQQSDHETVRSALIAAAAWKGDVVLRTRREGNHAILEVQDNGIGMTEDVRIRCTQTHFSTKRDNAVYEGNTTGMGLGLSFVAVVLSHHRAEMEIESAPLHGTLFRIRISVSFGVLETRRDGSGTVGAAPIGGKGLGTIGTAPPESERSA
jgi:signal transduction histidine kinase